MVDIQDKIEDKILKLFLYSSRLKFSQIESKLRLRSNKLSYHLTSLVQRDILKKERGVYFLSESIEELIPYLSDKKSVLPVVLIHIGNSKKAFLYKREKRPFFGKLSLPGGRILIGENFTYTGKRIMKDKFNINVKIKKIKGITLEHVKKKGKIFHSFLLVVVEAVSLDKIDLIDIEKNKKNIISSDYKLITCKSHSVQINTLFTLGN